MFVIVRRRPRRRHDFAGWVASAAWAARAAPDDDVAGRQFESNIFKRAIRCCDDAITSISFDGGKERYGSIDGLID